MKHVEFISVIENDYSKYSETEIKLVAQLIKSLTEEKLDDLYMRVRANCDTHNKEGFKMPPPSFKKLFDIIPKRSVGSEAVEAWALVCKYSNPYNDIIFDNPAIHYGLQMAGGWKQFCFRTKEDDIWFKKRFVEAYKRFKEEDLEIDHRPFRGELDFNPLVMVGNKEKCKQIVNDIERPAIDKTVVENLRKLQYVEE